MSARRGSRSVSVCAGKPWTSASCPQPHALACAFEHSNCRPRCCCRALGTENEQTTYNPNVHASCHHHHLTQPPHLQTPAPQPPSPASFPPSQPHPSLYLPSSHLHIHMGYIEVAPGADPKVGRKERKGAVGRIHDGLQIRGRTMGAVRVLCRDRVRGHAWSEHAMPET